MACCTGCDYLAQPVAAVACKRMLEPDSLPTARPLPADYTPPVFQARALQHTNVQVGRVGVHPIGVGGGAACL